MSRTRWATKPTFLTAGGFAFTLSHNFSLRPYGHLWGRSVPGALKAATSRARHFIMRSRRASNGTVRPLTCGVSRRHGDRMIKGSAGLLIALLPSIGAWSQAPSTPLILNADEPPPVTDAGCGTIRILVSAEQTDGRFAIVEGRECDRVTGLHVHHSTDESFYVVEGTLTVYVDGAVRVLGPGAYVFIPRGTPHAQGNPSSTPNKIITTFVPAGFEGAFRERAELVREVAAGTEEFLRRQAEIRARYDIEPLGESPIGR